MGCLIGRDNVEISLLLSWMRTDCLFVIVDACGRLSVCFDDYRSGVECD